MKSCVFSHTQPPGERHGVAFVSDSPGSFFSALSKTAGPY
jgi:hypothetical protein